MFLQCLADQLSGAWSKNYNHVRYELRCAWHLIYCWLSN